MLTITPDLRLLRCFVAVAQELHFGRAAANLQIAQPSISRAIRDLERALDTQLFTRTKRTVRLTAAGQALLAEAPRALEEVERAYEQARRVGRGESGELTLGFLPSTATELVPAVVRAYRASYPGVGLRLLELLDDRQVEGLLERRLDVGLLRTHRTEGEIAFEPLRREGLTVAVARDHRLARRKRIRYADLRGEALIMWPRAEAAETFDTILGACRSAGFSPEVIQEASSAHTIIGLAAAGVGVAVIASAFAAHTGADVVFIPIVDSELVLYLAWRQHEASPIRDNLLAAARQAAEGLQQARRGQKSGFGTSKPSKA